METETASCAMGPAARPKQGLQRAILAARVVLCSILALVILEGCARLDDSLTDGAPFIGAYGYTSMLTFDGQGVVGRPYAHYRKWKLNAYGYRGPDIVWDGRERIICIGASETFGFTESENMEYPRQLERELNRRAGYNRYQVVNVAYAGQSLGTFARRMDGVFATLKPGIALLYPSSSAYLELPLSDSGDVNWVAAEPGFDSRLKHKTFDRLAELPEGIEMIRDRIHIWKVVRETGTIQRVPASNIEYFHRDLCRVLDRLQQDRVVPVLITHATRFGKRVRPEDYAMLIFWRRFTPQLDDSGFLDFENRFNDVIRSEAAARNLVLIDAADKLWGRDNFADFAHFTDRGAHAMANVIADGLLEPRAALANAADSRVVSALVRSHFVISQ